MPLSKEDIWDVEEVFEESTIEITKPKFTITCNTEFEDAHKMQFVEVARLKQVLKEIREKRCDSHGTLLNCYCPVCDTLREIVEEGEGEA